METVEVFTHAIVGNLGLGFDFVVCAVDVLCDHVIAKRSDQTPPGKVSISRIIGDGSHLNLNAKKNYVGIAGKATMELLGVRSIGISMELHKGLPLGSGLGSSAASVIAATVAINALFGSLLSKQDLVLAGHKSEVVVSGYYVDNVAPSFLGGFVLVNSYDPLQLIELALPVETGLYFILVGPEFEAPTKHMQVVLPNLNVHKRPYLEQ